MSDLSSIELAVQMLFLDREKDICKYHLHLWRQHYFKSIGKEVQ